MAKKRNKKESPLERLEKLPCIGETTLWEELEKKLKNNEI